MTTVVIMPGGFHPFHPGHLALYQSAQRTFPDAEVYVAATNDKSDRPFDISDKQRIAYAAGVELGHFVQVKSPFQAMEIASQYDPDKDVLIFVRSEKDANSPPRPGGVKKDGSPSYLQPLLGAKQLEPFKKHAYMAYLPTIEFGPGAFTSASEIRAAWPRLNAKRKLALVMSLYPSTQKDPMAAKDIVNIFDQTIGGVAENQGWAATYEADGLTAGFGSTGGMHATYQDRYNQPVDEARIHFTDPKTPVNLYYIPPKLQASGQVQNVAHNIPYSTVMPLIQRIKQKYPSMNPEYMVWYPMGQDRFGQRLKEDYIDERSNC
jgi:glycerol-3-phosphate cytidylyltransferase-like family protein